MEATPDGGPSLDKRQPFYLSYREVEAIHVQLALINERLKSISHMGAEMSDLEVRVRALELSHTKVTQNTSTWRDALSVINTMILTGIAVAAFILN